MSATRCSCWEEAKTFKDAMLCMIKFLKGKMDSTPWHYDKVDEETVNILPKLVQINKLGFMTVEGQPGFMDKSILPYFLERILEDNRVWVYTEKLDAIKLHGMNKVDEDVLSSNTHVSESYIVPLTIDVQKDTLFTRLRVPASLGMTNISVIDMNHTLQKDIVKNTELVVIVGKEWGDNSVIDLVIKSLG